jgi:hypothetical protein
LTHDLQDEHAIRNLAACYSHAVARQDGEAAAATYAEDGVLSAFFGPEIVGRLKLAEVFTQTFAALDFIVQTCSAGVIELHGDRARASWSVSEWYRHKGEAELGCCFGLYEDQLVRTPAGWRFERRRFHPFYRGSSPSTGKLYRRPEAFANNYSPWPFLGSVGPVALPSGDSPA